ncbi:hypothetical protein F4781DRAFT_114404 [Annulohypoxylon bovei var. microspora]|nr:hypothetical protein F4781DRAFT_114404 [Annulohypoxylon bovei var. microspora]
MKSIIFRGVAFLATVALVDAQTTTTTSTTAATTTTACPAQNILDTCLDTTESYVTLCGTTDYMCLCDKYVAIVTCFDNCPNDSRKSSYQQQKDLYCQNASLYATTSGNLTMSRSTTPTSVAAATTSTDVVIKSVDVSSTNAAATESGNDAQERIAAVGGVLAGVAGIMVVFL